MSYKVVRVGGHCNSSNIREFICQDESDIKKLPRNGIGGVQSDKSDTVSNAPCAVGSTAIVCSSSQRWILSPENIWIKLSDNNIIDSGTW